MKAKLAIDINGNSIVKLTFNTGRGFSIQVNGNLNNPLDLEEIYQYVKKCGTDRERMLVDELHPVLTTYQLQMAIDLNAKFKGCYFWAAPRSASSRRYMESQNTLELKGVFKGHRVEIEMSVSCSCKNVYFEQSIKVDGKSCTIAKIKRMIK